MKKLSWLLLLLATACAGQPSASTPAASTGPRTVTPPPTVQTTITAIWTFHATADVNAFGIANYQDIMNDIRITQFSDGSQEFWASYSGAAGDITSTFYMSSTQTSVTQEFYDGSAGSMVRFTVTNGATPTVTGNTSQGIAVTVFASVDTQFVLTQETL